MNSDESVQSYNSRAWDRNVERGNPWTLPVGSSDIQKARNGDWKIFLTPSIPIPSSWFPSPLQGKEVLGLASGGGQQGPILAAAGANVTIFDNSSKQLARDREVAKREGLHIQTVQGDMADLSAFKDNSFDLVIHPASNVFSPRVRPVWKEAFRVLRAGGAIFSGFMNPAIYLFDPGLAKTEGILRAVHPLPYVEPRDMTPEMKAEALREEIPFEFSHSLDDQIGGQIDAGFVLTGFFEDNYAEADRVNDPVSQIMPTCLATRALKPLGAP